jgi:hypothetical protein
MLLVNGSQQSKGFLPKGLKLSDYCLLEDDRKYVRVWALQIWRLSVVNAPGLPMLPEPPLGPQ